MKLNIQNIKFIILLAFIGFASIFFTIDTFFTNTTAARSNNPPAARTGAPGEANCTDCHNQNAATGQFSIVAPANYTPGQTYSIQVKNVTTDTSRRIWGFSLIPLTTVNAMAGTLTGTTTTVTRVSGTKTYIGQNTAGSFQNQSGGSTWTFNWTAPATNVGNITFYAAGIQGDDDGSESGDQTYTTTAVTQPQATVVIHHGFSDFDGDGKADTSVFRPTSGTWIIDRSTLGLTGYQLGIATDKIVPADFDGDDKADIAVWREAPATEAAFYILNSSNSTLRIEKFGQTGDKPIVTGDWDGDGKADPAVYREGSQSYFYFRGSLNNPNNNTTFLPWGTIGDKPVLGDYDGDGKSDSAIFRNGVWYIRLSSTNQLRVDYWGLSTDKIVAADYDGDSKTDLAVFRGGIWYIKQSSNSVPVYYSWGLNTDTVVPADFDGDGKTDAAVFRNGIWYIRLSSGIMSARNFGLSSDLPVANAFVQ